MINFQKLQTENHLFIAACSSCDVTMHPGKSLINQSLLCNLHRHQFIKADVSAVQALFPLHDYWDRADRATKRQFSPSPLALTETQKMDKSVWMAN